MCGSKSLRRRPMVWTGWDAFRLIDITEIKSAAGGGCEGGTCYEKTARPGLPASASSTVPKGEHTEAEMGMIVLEVCQKKDWPYVHPV
jgi:hypothetical protein